MMSTKQNAIIQNSWCFMEKEIKRIFALAFVISIVCLIISYLLNNSFLILLGVITFIGTSVTVPLSFLKKDTSSEWDKFMYTLPISKIEIVKSKFRFIEQLTSIYLVVIGVFLFIAYNLNIGLDLETVCTLIMLTISVGIVGQSLMYTNSLKLKDVTGDSFITFILIISASVGLIPMRYIDIYGSKNHDYGLFIHVTIALLLIMIIEFVCYKLCQKYINEKEF